MMGDRDSELAVLVVDNAKVQSRMNEGEYNAGSLTLALRKECFRVLLGSDSNPTINIDDPVSDNFFNEVWNKTASENTSTYERVFQCLPSNSTHSLRELQEHVKTDTLAQSDPETAAKDVRAICGILVYFPLDFLCEENLLPKAFSKEGMLPERVWT